MTATGSRTTTPVLRLRRFHALWDAAAVYLAGEHQMAAVAALDLRSIRCARANRSSPRSQTLGRIGRVVEVLDGVAARNPEAEDQAIGAAVFHEAMDHGASRNYALGYLSDIAVPVEAVSCYLHGTRPAW